jgi:hypothetical protein
MTTPEIARQYLFDFLQDEFGKYPEVRIRMMPENHEDGVMVRTESREYFFPTDWMQGMQMQKVREEIRRLKDSLPYRNEP